MTHRRALVVPIAAVALSAAALAAAAKPRGVVAPTAYVTFFQQTWAGAEEVPVTTGPYYDVVVDTQEDDPVPRVRVRATAANVWTEVAFFDSSLAQWIFEVEGTTYGSRAAMITTAPLPTSPTK